MATMTVQPRPTPGERADSPVEVEVDDRLADLAAMLDDFDGRQDNWDLALREGTDFGRVNNVEAQLLFAAGAGTSSISFRLDQLDGIDELGEEQVLVLRFEENDGIVKMAELSGSGLAVDLFHIATYT
jgi:hypothetical protein